MISCISDLLYLKISLITQNSRLSATSFRTPPVERSRTLPTCRTSPKRHRQRTFVLLQQFSGNFRRVLKSILAVHDLYSRFSRFSVGSSQWTSARVKPASRGSRMLIGRLFSTSRSPRRRIGMCCCLYYEFCDNN